MSHNSKYYVKRLTKNNAKALPKITSFIKSVQNQTVSQIIEKNHSATSASARHETHVTSSSSNETAPLPLDENSSSSTDESSDVVPTQSSTCTKTCDLGHIIIAGYSDSSSGLKAKKCQLKQNIMKPVSNVDIYEPVALVPDSRKFAEIKYEKNFPWLYFSTLFQGYMCKYCELFGSTTNLKKSFSKKGVRLGTHPTRTLLIHQNSKFHKCSVERYTLSKANTTVVQQLTLHANTRMNENRAALKKIFQCIDFLIKQKWALSENVEKLVRFVARLGVKDLQKHLSNPAHVKYLSSNSVSDMVICMSDTIEQKVLELLGDQEFSLLADESSDAANRSQMSVMIRFAEKQKVTTHFMGFIHLDKGTAEYITAALQAFMVGKMLDPKKMMFTGFDGCNTMSGVQKGVQRRLRHLNPFSVYVNCRNHRLALCLVHLIKRFPLLQDVDSALLSLWKLFEFSPQKLAVFKHIQSVYGKAPLAITRAATTRWLSHLQASSRFISRFVCILDTLDALYAEKREPELQGIRASITDKKTVATILLLCDILKPVNMLSLYLQETNINFTDLPSHVQDTIDCLTSLVEIYRQNTGNLDDSQTEFSKCGGLFFEIEERTNLQRRLRAGEDVTPDAYLEEIGIPLVYDLIQEIQDAFCTGDPVLAAFGFFNPKNLPESVSDLQEYGNVSIQRLVTFYGAARSDTFSGHVTEVPAMMDPVQLETELKSVRTQLFMLRRNGNSTLEDVYTAFCRDNVLAECFPCTKKLLYLCMIIPPSTAVVERSFSLMSNILTKKRNRLSQRQLDAVARITYQQGELDDHDLEALVEKFKSQRSRKLGL